MMGGNKVVQLSLILIIYIMYIMNSRDHILKQ